MEDNRSRWPTKEKKEDPSPTTTTTTTKSNFGFYTKEELLDLFMPKDEIPLGFKVWDAVSLQSPLEPINKGKLFRVPHGAKINPSGFMFGKGRGGKTRGAKRGGRGGRGGKSDGGDTHEDSKTPLFSFESEWYYKDKNGGENHGPYTLKKLVEWVETGFHSGELEVQQEGQTTYIKLKDIITKLEKSGRLMKNDPESEDESLEPIKHEVLEPEEEPQEEEEEEEEEEDEVPELPQRQDTFFSNVLVKFAETDPWSGEKIDHSRHSPITTYDIEMKVKHDLGILNNDEKNTPKKKETVVAPQPKKTKQEIHEEERKIKFEQERKLHLEDQKKKQEEKKKQDAIKKEEKDKKTKEEEKKHKLELERETARLKEMKIKEQQVNNAPAWGNAQGSGTMSLAEIQREEERQAKLAEKKKKQEEVKKPVTGSAWGVVQTEVVPFTQIQKEEKKTSKVDVKQSSWTKQEGTTKDVTAVTKVAWGQTAPLTTAPTSFAKIQQEDKKKKKEEEKPKITESTTSSVNVWAKQEPIKPVEKKKEVKNVVAPVVVPVVVPETSSKMESFWDEEPQTNAFSSQKMPVEVISEPIKKAPVKKELKKKEPSNKDTGSSYASILNKQSAPKKKGPLDQKDYPVLPKSEGKSEESVYQEIAKPSKNKQLNIFGGIEPSDSFKEWYKKQMSLLGRSYDLTLLYYLLSLKTKQETDDYIHEYIGTSDLSAKFAYDFTKLKDLESGNTK